VFRRNFPVDPEVVCEEISMLKDVELELDKLRDRVRDDGIREVVYGRKAERLADIPKEPASCFWCKEPITDETRKYFCCDQHEGDWSKRKNRQAALEDNPGVGFAG
jgi:hypothetical protein